MKSLKGVLVFLVGGIIGALVTAVVGFFLLLLAGSWGICDITNPCATLLPAAVFAAFFICGLLFVHFFVTSPKNS